MSQSLHQGRRKLSEGGAAALLDQSGDAGNIEAPADENSARSAEKFFSPSFSVIRIGSRGTFVLGRLGSVAFKLFAAIDL